MSHAQPELDAPSTLGRVRAAYGEGRYHDAHAAGFGELREWPTMAGRVMAARIAARLGAPRLAQALVFRAYRDDPKDAQSAYFYAHLIFQRRGAWHALQHLRALPQELMRLPDLVSLEARAYGELRDLERAVAPVRRFTRRSVGRASAATSCESSTSHSSARAL